jgi:hypothetical protein
LPIGGHRPENHRGRANRIGAHAAHAIGRILTRGTHVAYGTNTSATVDVGLGAIHDPIAATCGLANAA